MENAPATGMLVLHLNNLIGTLTRQEMSSCYQKHRRWRCPGRAVVFSFLLNYSNLQKGRLQLECKVVVVYLFEEYFLLFQWYGEFIVYWILITQKKKVSTHVLL